MKRPEDYLARFRRVLVHIDEHLDDDLAVEALAAVAAFSKFHFHRQFGALFGISVHRYVQLARLKRASYRLAFRRDRIVDIALEAGYEGPEAFARAFKGRLGQSPSDFRAGPQWADWLAACEPLNATRRSQMTSAFAADQVGIIDFPATAVAMLDHRGAPALVGETVRRFIAWRKQVGLRPDISATFNILYADPDSAAPEEYRLGLCAATDRPVAPNDQGVTAGVIPAGRCALLRLVGSSDDLRAAAKFLYGVWLPASGEELRDFPLFCRRLRFFPDVPEHEAVTDLYLPLA